MHDLEAGSERAPDTITLVLADDSPVFLDALVELFASEPRFLVLGTARDTAALVRLGCSTRPDVVLADVGMSGGGAAVAATELRRCAPGTLVIALSGNASTGLDRSGLAASGALGPLSKTAPAADLLAFTIGALVTRHP